MIPLLPDCVGLSKNRGGPRSEIDIHDLRLIYVETGRNHSTSVLFYVCSQQGDIRTGRNWWQKVVLKVVVSRQCGLMRGFFCLSGLVCVW